MILIADSGSTKTSWVLTGRGKENRSFHSQGFNPYTQSKEQISIIIRNEVFPEIKNVEISHLYFYGAGCSTNENRTLMYNCFKEFFKNSEIDIEHDLLGAARSLWFDGEGIVGILGTGSNTCVYNGEIIVEQVPNLGYILGDEGSGAYMGKRLLRDFIYHDMPESLIKKFNNKFSLDTETILDYIYKKENPNRWLAGFSYFIADNIEEEYCNELVISSFRDFFKVHITKYSRYRELPLGIIGSLGLVFKKHLTKVSEEYDINLQKIIKGPINELVKYHLMKEHN